MLAESNNPDGKRGRHSKWYWITWAALALLVAIGIAIAVAIHYAEPILRARVIETLSVHFHGPVELTSFHVSVADGFQVSGAGLKVFGNFDPNIHQPGIQPLIGVDEFRFQAGIVNLLHTPMRIHRVYLKGLLLNIPPKQQRDGGLNVKKSKIKIYVDEFVCDQAALVINTSQPDKLPLEFDIRQLRMQRIGPAEALHFDASLINPKPVGEIQSSGFFGPWQPDEPRNTPLKGSYSFSNADLSTIRGIGGTLSSTGEYEGKLGEIIVDGKTETPDFRIATGGRVLPMQTEFHAEVDGTSGDTYLNPVKAKIQQSWLVATGSVVRVKDSGGHRVLLDVRVSPARIGDLLELGVRTDPPVMSGAVELATKFDLPPGGADVADRLQLDGSFHISDAHFSNDKVQSKVNALSLRSEGKPREAKAGTGDDVPSDMTGTFTLRDGLLSFSQLRFEMPGTIVDLRVEYSLDGNQFDFHGTARMKAKLSHMVGGWKSMLLKPADPFFSKNGAGTQLPVKVTGTKSAPHFGLDFGHKGDSVQSEVEHKDD